MWSGVVTAIIGFAIKFTMGWRISEEDEVDGIDFAEHGESAYDLHTASEAASEAAAAAPSSGRATPTKEGASA